jgi:ABC-2 type transport system ATP-binding protein
MRQRAKIAAALVTGPTVMVLDEPLNGADPVQRNALIDLFHALGDQGRTVIISSHVLHEVQRLAQRQLVLIRGRLAAAGSHRAIRDALADRPRSVLVRTTEPRRLAGDLLASEAVQGVTVDGDSIVISSTHAGELAELLPTAARDAGARLREVRPLDDSLESVFRELLR